MGTVRVATLLSGVTTISTGAAGGPALAGKKTFQAVVAGTGAVSATVKVQGSNDGDNWVDIATITLAGTTSAKDGFAADAPWAYYRGDVTAISGTGAAVTLNVGEG